MSDSTNKSPLAKRQFYAQPEIAKAYDDQRFGGASGAWVNAREIEIALGLAAPFRRALDLGCGTGRLMRALASRGDAVGVDTSFPMLAQASSLAPRGDSVEHSPTQASSLAPRGRTFGYSLAQADAFSLPFADASFDAVIALRFVFHFANLSDLLREIARVLAPRGVIVFDAYTWSPRVWLPLNPSRWGGGIYYHPKRAVEQIAAGLGMRIADEQRAFLFSPYIYRLLPLGLVHALARVEMRLPERVRSRMFWKLARTN